MRGMTFHASPETRRFAFAYSTSPRATGATSDSQLGRIHLVVGRHDARHVDLLLERAAVAGRDRGAHAGVALVPEDLHARVADALGRRRPFRRATRRRRRRSGRRTRGCRGSSRRRGAPRRTRARRPRPACPRASGRRRRRSRAAGRRSGRRRARRSRRAGGRSAPRRGATSGSSARSSCSPPPARRCGSTRRSRRG